MIELTPGQSYLAVRCLSCDAQIYPVITKAFFLVTILCCFALCSPAQSVMSPENQFANDPCGDPTRESMVWTPVQGRAVKVVDGNTIIISVDNKPLRVLLVAVDAPSLDHPFGREAQQFLQKILGGKAVEVCVNPSDWAFQKRRPKVITGVVYLRREGLEDANLALIRAGLARHIKSKPYTMSNYTECQYVRAEWEAHKAKRGIWQLATEKYSVPFPGIGGVSHCGLQTL
jgi:endonuclease YncB( thermonuclease family)